MNPTAAAGITGLMFGALAVLLIQWVARRARPFLKSFAAIPPPLPAPTPFRKGKR